MIITGIPFTIYCLAAIAANVISALTGFGNAIIFILIYQIFEFLDLMAPSTLKYTRGGIV